MPSDTTPALMQSAYDRLLAFVDDTGRTLSTYVGTDPTARIYMDEAPTENAYPYIILRHTRGRPDPEVGNLREFFDIEAHCVHRQRDKEIDCETIADLVEEALLTWQESGPTLGLTCGQSSTRETMPTLTDPSNRDLIEVVVTVTCFSWSIRLSNALT